jgi:hypothetical protein
LFLTAYLPLLTNIFSGLSLGLNAINDIGNEMRDYRQEGEIRDTRSQLQQSQMREQEMEARMRQMEQQMQYMQMQQQQQQAAANK